MTFDPIAGFATTRPIGSIGSILWKNSEGTNLVETIQTLCHTHTWELLGGPSAVPSFRLFLLPHVCFLALDSLPALHLEAGLSGVACLLLAHVEIAATRATAAGPPRYSPSGVVIALGIFLGRFRGWRFLPHLHGMRIDLEYGRAEPGVESDDLVSALPDQNGHPSRAALALKHRALEVAGRHAHAIMHKLELCQLPAIVHRVPSIMRVFVCEGIDSDLLSGGGLAKESGESPNVACAPASDRRRTLPTYVVHCTCQVRCLGRSIP